MTPLSTFWLRLPSRLSQWRATSTPSPPKGLVSSWCTTQARSRATASGRGKAVIFADAGWGERVRYDLFQEFIPERREYRVSMLSGRVVSAYVKRPPQGTSPEDLRPDWSFEQAQVVPAAVVSTAREAA